MRLKKTAIVAVSLVALGGSLAACGSDDSSSSSSSASSSTASSTSSASSESSASSSSDGLTFDQAYCKTKPAADKATGNQMGDMTACFGTLTNNTDKDVTITGYTIPELEGDGAMFQLHEVVNGQMQEKKGGFTLKAGESKELAPGGEHLMIMDYKPEIAAGDELTIQFQTEDGQSFEVKAPAREVAAGNESYGGEGSESASTDMSGMNMSDMSEMHHSHH